MWVAYRKIRKLWVLYMFVMFFGIFMVFYCTKILLEHPANVLMKQHKLRLNERIKNLKSRNSPNVVVGHYIGQGNLFGNVSKDDLNINEFSPKEGEGADGKPVVIPPREMLIMQQKFQINRFNLLASDRIPLNRSLPDVRKKRCQVKKYAKKLPTTSVIIVFHNEAWSVLLRTVWSIVNRSPKHLIKEIILIDDASDREFLKSPLDDYVKNIPVPVKVLRLKTRDGLVAARLLGAKTATGETLTFLDAHCECSVGWLEPLLARVQQNRKKVVCPVIDIISDDNFSYVKSFEFHWGAFNWNLHFRWYSMAQNELQKRKYETSRPFRTPALAGGLFSIDREYFFEIGSYDSEMKIWGGDNLEMSFRIWQCGGEIEIAPCSHVGHLFRKSSPYTFPGGVNDILNKNLARLAMVWMDDWGKFFFKFNKNADDLKSALDVSERIGLRKTLNCRSFDWYLKEIWPQHFFPTDDRFFGRIKMFDSNSKSTKYLEVLNGFSGENDWEDLIDFLTKEKERFGSEVSEFCLTKPGSYGTFNQPLGPTGLKNCSRDSNSMEQMFIITEIGQIMTDEGICLDAPDHILENESQTKARMITCADSDRQKWKYLIKTQQLQHISSNYCIEAEIDSTVSLEKIDLYIRECATNKNTQKWILHPFDWK